MKLNTVEREATFDNANAIRGGAEFSAKAIKIVVNDMYSDKPRSIARELMSNAYDSHIEAGCPDKPFDVTVPTWIDPTFRVRDYGTGMSDWTIKNVYAVLFKSTKETTNQSLGKWGLGSKTPLSYVDSYSLTSYYQGFKSHYTIMFDDKGEIVVVPMGSEPTPDPDGVEVSFPVNKDDYRTFSRALRDAALGHDVKPNVTNAQEVGEFDEPVPTLEGKGWRMYKQGERSLSGPYARMGCVIYPVNISALGINRYDTTRRGRVLSRNLIMDFGIGDLEVTSSREDLSYGSNDPTSNAILGRVDEIIEEMDRKALADIAACSSLWGAMVRTDQLAALNGSELRRKAKWNGDSVPYEVEISDLKCLFGLHKFSSGPESIAWSPVRSKLKLTSMPKLTIIIASEKKGKRDVRIRNRVNDWYSETKERVIDARCGGPKTATDIEKYVEGSKFLQLRVGDGPDDDKNLQEILKMFGDKVPVFYVKDMPDNGTDSIRTKKKVPVRVVDAHGKESEVRLSQQEIDTGGYCIFTENGDTLTHPNFYTHNYRDRVKAAIELGLCDRVIVVPKTHWKKFDSKQWKSFFGLCYSWCQTEKNEKIDWLVKSHHNTARSVPKEIADLGDPSVNPHSKPKKEFQFAKKAAIDLLNGLKDQSYTEAFRKHQESVQAKSEMFFKRYPLLRGVTATLNIEHVKLYIKAVEKELNNG